VILRNANKEARGVGGGRWPREGGGRHPCRGEGDVLGREVEGERGKATGARKEAGGGERRTYGLVRGGGG
jgi:hypothetical protein